MTDAAASTASASETLTAALARRPAFVLLLVAVLGWLPGFLSLPPLDRDESRFAEASHQMVESGNYVDIRFASSTRYNKPVGIYWLQAAAVKLCGSADRIWPYRLPSLLGGFLSLAFLYCLARGFAPPSTALLSAVLLGTCLLMVAEADIATTDAAQLACIVAVQSVLMRVYRAGRENRQNPPGLLVLAGWAALGVGILIKGPVIVAVVAVTVLALGIWDRDARWLFATKPLPGVLIVLAIVAPWGISIGLASHGAFFRQSLGHDFAAKLVGGEESHGAPPGYYLALAILSFWPATLLLLPSLKFAIDRRSEPFFRYLLCWSGAAWLMFELVPTKLPHYVLPVYPALALLCALWATDVREENKSARILPLVGSVLFALGTAVLCGVCLLLPARLGGSVTWSAIVPMIAAIAASVAAVLYLQRGRARPALVSAAGSAVLFYAALAFGVIPQLQELWISPRAAALVAANRQANDAPVVLAGYVEPSLVFLLDGDVEMDNSAATAPAPPVRNGLALVETRMNAQFLDQLRAERAVAAPLGGVSGIDYSTGRQQHLTLYRIQRTGPK